MPRPLFDSPYIFGLHDPGGENIMAEMGRRGWIVFTEEIGSDPNNTSGKDFLPWANQDFGILCRINNGYGSAGTIPHSSQYADFARRVANYVAASRGCKLWIIGNEMNHSQEWPAIPGVRRALAAVAVPAQRGPEADPRGRGSATRFSALQAEVTATQAPSAGPSATERAAATVREVAGFEKITPERYARCFRLCRDAIKLLPGHGDDQVLIGAVAPWNNQTTYPGNTIGDWVRYLQDVLSLLGAGSLDGIALHTYTHGSDPALITDPGKMNAPFQDRYYNFLAYRDLMNAIPASMRDLPVYITETDEDAPWLDQNNGWVQAAYAEINRWNQQANAQQIHSLALYRWPPYDKWHIQGKQGVIDDFRAALRNDYRWKPAPPKPAAFKAGDTVRTLDFVNFRQAPGGQVLTQLPPNTSLLVISSQYVLQNGLVWWNLQRKVDNATQDGWAAQYTQDGVVLLEKTTPPPSMAIQPGDQVRTLTTVRVRRSPGTTGKPAGDIIADVPSNVTLTVYAGPQPADNMTWWRNTGTLPGGLSIGGWMAEALPDGTRLLEKVVPAPEPPAILEPSAAFGPGDRVRTTTTVRMRRSPGATGKPSSDVLAAIPPGTVGVVTGVSVSGDEMDWWPVRTTDASGQVVQGWMADALPDGTPLLEKVGEVPTAKFSQGDLAVAADFANVRRSAGLVSKPADDVLGMFSPRSVVVILGGPESKDDLPWWRIGGILTPAGEVRGYVAETAPGGQPLLVDPPKLPGTGIPDKSAGTYLRAPFDETYGIAQLWGENSSFYSRFAYDGVGLLGHNGIDFLTPTGTLLYAADGGQVAQTGFEQGGFGNFMLLRHPWGESIYAHLDSIGVTPGQVVGRGQYVGVAGNTGGSSGPHLHFAIRIDTYSRSDGWGGFSDPLPYLPPASCMLPPYVLDPATLAIRAAAVPVPGDQYSRGDPAGMGDVPGDERP